MLKSIPKYSSSVGRDVEQAIHKFTRGELKGSKGGYTVHSRKQAIAIGLS